MNKIILDYLYSFKDDEWHEINAFLKENFIGKDWDVRQSLQNLVEKGRIKILGNKYMNLCGHIKIHEGDMQNTAVTFDNYKIEGKLTNDEREKMDSGGLETKIKELTKRSLEREEENTQLILDLQKAQLALSKAQHADIPINAVDRKTVITWQIIAAILGAATLTLGFLLYTCKN